MIDLLIDTIKESPLKIPEEAHVVARVLIGLIQKGDELSLSAQVMAFYCFGKVT